MHHRASGVVDLNESPRMPGAVAPPWGETVVRPRAPTVSISSSRKLSQMYNQSSPTSPDAIHLHEPVGGQHHFPSSSSSSGPPSPASMHQGHSPGRMSKRSFLARRSATRSDPIPRPLPLPPGLSTDQAPSRPRSLPLEQYGGPARGPTQELDGGVRLAGGPPTDEWDRLSDVLPTIPPPYRRFSR